MNARDGSCSRCGAPRISRRQGRLALSLTFVAPLLLASLTILAAPAAAQWSRVTDLPSSDIFSVSVSGDTIVAGADTAVWVSTNGGATWKPSTRPNASVNEFRSVLVHDERLYAGTFGQGVFVSDDLGDTWSNFSQGLVGGIGNSVLTIMGMVESGNHLYAATEGAGAWTRDLASGTWSLFGSQTLQDFQASNMDNIAAGGTQLFAMGGFNGTVFIRNPGDPDWTVSLLFNDHFAPGLAGLNAIWTGRRWVVGSNIGMFSSPTGQAPWDYVDLGLHSLFFVGLAQRGNEIYASLGAGGGSLVASSLDDGVTWRGLDTLAAVGIYRLAIHGNDLYAGRVDGLWRRSIGTLSAAGDPVPTRLAFALLGPHPIRGEARFRIDLPQPARVKVSVFDVSGRRTTGTIERSLPAGTNEVRWNAAALAPGVYLARLEAGERTAALRFVRLQ